MGRTAVITGVGGQDGRYLADLLVEKGWNVIGVNRRSSQPRDYLNDLKEKGVKLIEGDITDYSSVEKIVKQYKPHHYYHLAAQSHVATSFQEPLHTWDATGKAVLNILEVIRNVRPETRLYNAASSEMFGSMYSIYTTDGYSDISNHYNINNVKIWDACGHDEKTYKECFLNTASHLYKPFQNEDTPMRPQSPYGIAKLAGFNATRLYRESYGLFTCSGILFNHECIKYDYPFIIRYEDHIDILPIQDIATRFSDLSANKVNNKQGSKLNQKVEVWDENGWVDISCISWFRNKDKKLKLINARNAIFSVSDDHVCFMEDSEEKKAGEINVGEKIKNIDLPTTYSKNEITKEEAKLLGMLVGDGHVSIDYYTAYFANSDETIRQEFTSLWEKVSNGKSIYKDSFSGFTNGVVGRLDLSGGSKWLKKFELYTECLDTFGHRYKKIPKQVLNSTPEIMQEFLIGYNLCDGLKSNPCKYLFKNFKTNSPVLASGLLFLISNTTKQDFNITIEESEEHSKKQFYYSINLLSDTDYLVNYKIVKSLLEQGFRVMEISRKTGINRHFIGKVKKGFIPTKKGSHRALIQNEVKKIITVDDYDGMFFDIETSSGKMHAGIGKGVIHNSELRSLTFVTRKITNYVSRVRLAKELGKNIEKLKLGNLEAKRDWSHASDMVRAMHMMLCKDEPDDFVVGSGETYSVRDFAKRAFNTIGENWEEYVEVDQAFVRPAEVDYLCSNPSKAHNVLGWKPLVTFDELIRRMVENDIKRTNTKYKVYGDI